MLFLVFGSSGAGKSFALHELRERRPELAIHEFDEIGAKEPERPRFQGVQRCAWQDSNLRPAD
jgi:hypothetical protein